MPDALAESFRRWSTIEAVSNVSPLYEVLGVCVADDAELLALAAEARPGQPPPNMLFAAAHALLREERTHPLAAYYASLGGTSPPDERTCELFREFCLERRGPIGEILRTRMVQTNEVRRSAVLMPAFATVAELAGGPLALFEIGPSAGLNLLFDRYGYTYGDARLGVADSPVVLSCEPRGPVPGVNPPVVASRLGVDLNPLSVTSVEDMEWLRALIWPEHLDRLALLDAAISVALFDPPELVAGDFREVLPARIGETPPEQAVCIFATFVLNQFPAELLRDLRGMLRELSRARTVYFMVMGFPEFIEPGREFLGETGVWILRMTGGTGEYLHHSTANPHGRWIELQTAAAWQPWEAPD